MNRVLFDMCFAAADFHVYITYNYAQELTLLMVSCVTCEAVVSTGPSEVARSLACREFELYGDSVVAI